MSILENKNSIEPMTSAHPKKLENEEQIKYKISKRKERINIRAEINILERRKNIEKDIKTK